MGTIPSETIEQIAAANDIVEVIGSYFPLKRAGTNFKALCPFIGKIRHPVVSPSQRFIAGCGWRASSGLWGLRACRFSSPSANSRRGWHYGGRGRRRGLTARKLLLVRRVAQVALRRNVHENL
jgi:hypothetical protein